MPTGLIVFDQYLDCRSSHLHDQTMGSCVKLHEPARARRALGRSFDLPSGVAVSAAMMNGGVSEWGSGEMKGRP